jgi:hypothetical protein
METGGKQTRETREKIRQATLKQWQDPAFIAFMAEVRKRPRVAPRKKQTGRPKGTPHSAETREKLRQHALMRCQDPTYRARLAELGKLANAIRAARKKPPKPKRPHAGRPRVRPLEGTPEYQWYRKVAATLGIDAARSLGLGNAT